MLLKGIAAAEGMALAKSFLMIEKLIEDYTSEKIDDRSIAQEVKKFISHRDSVVAELERIKSDNNANDSKLKSDIVEIHQMLLEDQMLVEDIIEKIENEKFTALGAVQKTIGEQAATLEELEDNYFRERALDIRDIGSRLINHMLGVKGTDLSNLSEEVILVAKDIMPSQMVSADASKVKGIITELGGTTSHTAIIAKNMDIPAITGAANITNLIEGGKLIAVNGLEGTIETQLSQERFNEIEQVIRENDKKKLMLKSLVGQPAATKDGKIIELLSNVIDSNSVDKALEVGSDGVGLYRTEFLFMEREKAPTEEEQYQAYKEVLTKMGGRPVTIRTLDIGGDKEIPYLNLPKEENPFLGYRAIRICLDEKQLFKTQLRAILRASAFGSAQIMYPMISSLEEVRAANTILEEVKLELIKEGYEFDQEIPVGIMIEIPSAAAISDILIKEVDFFSIGTNDLTQYLLAVDRMNEKINSLYNYYHPAVLRVIAQIIQTVSKEDGYKSVSMCGEMAGDPVATQLLLGMGLNKFSTNPASILKIKKVIRSTALSEAREITERVLRMSTVEEIEGFIRNKYYEII